MQRLDQRRKLARDRREVGRRHGEIPVRELLMRAARARSGQYDTIDGRMVQHQLGGCKAQIRHRVIVARRSLRPPP
jgi:hypothetical protein